MNLREKPEKNQRNRLNSEFLYKCVSEIPDMVFISEHLWASVRAVRATRHRKMSLRGKFTPEEIYLNFRLLPESHKEQKQQKLMSHKLLGSQAEEETNKVFMFD